MSRAKAATAQQTPQAPPRLPQYIAPEQRRQYDQTRANLGRLLEERATPPLLTLADIGFVSVGDVIPGADVANFLRARPADVASRLIGLRDFLEGHETLTEDQIVLLKHVLSELIDDTYPPPSDEPWIANWTIVVNAPAKAEEAA